MKTDLFQSCGHCRVFQICWHIECSTFIASSFRQLKDKPFLLLAIEKNSFVNGIDEDFIFGVNCKQLDQHNLKKKKSSNSQGAKLEM